MSTYAWDGRSYDRISAIQQAWAAEVLTRLELRGSETVLDAGCGSGRITEMLAQRLPQGRVIAVDGSPSMIAEARERVRTISGGATVEVRQCDLLELELEAPVDAVLSTATFHWIADHARLFERVHAALIPGGQFVAQCGGEGNIDELRGRAREVLARAPYAQHFANWRAPWNYASAERTLELLLGAGFTGAQAWLEPSPQVPQQPREFLSTIVLGPHVQQLPEDLRARFMDDVLELVGEPVVIDYVRLNIIARA